jgi:hypothetical protein
VGEKMVIINSVLKDSDKYRIENGGYTWILWVNHLAVLAVCNGLGFNFNRTWWSIRGRGSKISKWFWNVLLSLESRDNRRKWRIQFHFESVQFDVNSGHLNGNFSSFKSHGSVWFGDLRFLPSLVTDTLD